MINRACISINNRCNLKCSYCHFHEEGKVKFLKEQEMNVFNILDNIMNHIDKYNIPKFKLGFVGNGEPLLDFDRLRQYIIYIKNYTLNEKIAAYTITNGTLVTAEILNFMKAYNVNIGFSIDGIAAIHNKYRCNSYTSVIKSIELYNNIYKAYPSMNCTVSRDILNNSEETIEFFKQFSSRITFSRMIGPNGITLSEFNEFLNEAKQYLNIRTGGFDCTMYGGKCGAGMNNVFYSNGKIYICGNCIDLPPLGKSDIALDKIQMNIKPFNRSHCYKEEL